MIDTARSAIKAPRDSVHFAVNHAVTAHAMGSWDTKPIALILPWANTMKIKGNNFFGGVAGDFYSRGPVKIPEGSVIVRKNSKIPPGKYKLQNAAKIKEFKDMKGCYVVEAAEDTNTKNIVDKIIQKMGYKLKDTKNAFVWGNKENQKSFNEFKGFNMFLREHNMKPSFHTYTPNGKIEMLISHLQFLDGLGKSWLIKYGDDMIFNYKKEYLKAINAIKKLSKQSGYSCDFDLNKLKSIIKKAKTPVEANEMLKKEMNILSCMGNQDGIDLLKSENSVYQDAAGVFMFNMFFACKSINTQKYLNIPNKTNLKEMEVSVLEDRFNIFELGKKFEKYM